MAQMSRNDSFGLVLLASATLSYAQDVPCCYHCYPASRCCPVSQLCGVSRRHCVVLASRWSRGQSLVVVGHYDGGVTVVVVVVVTVRVVYLTVNKHKYCRKKK
jgi:hypothetical protein